MTDAERPRLVSASDRAVVLHVTAAAKAAGPEAVASAIAIHRERIDHARGEVERLYRELMDQYRSIDMRQLAIDELEKP